MSFSEFSIISWWWGMIFLLTLLFFPISKNIFPHFIDRGWIFVKTLSIAIISYVVFLLGILHLVPFTRNTSVIILLLLGLGIYYLQRNKTSSQNLKHLVPIILFEEVAFFIILTFWVTVRGYNPEIHGLEKYMDFGFMNSILRSEHFPPKDMWLTPFTINYYYFGHLTTAVLTKISGIASNYAYNLMLGTIVGLCFVSGFSLAINLAKETLENTKKENLKRIIAGLLTAFLLTFAGNLHTVYTFFTPYQNEKPVPPFSIQLPIKLNKSCEVGSFKQGSCTNYNYSLTFRTVSFSTLGFNPLTFPNSYWYPNATRFIYNTIHEFPIYSWVVADLHGHVLDIPFVLLTIAVLYSLFVKSQIAKNVNQTPTNSEKTKHHIASSSSYLNFFRTLRIEAWDVVLVSLLLAIMYMTNAWDGLIYLLLTGFVFLAIASKHFQHGKSITTFTVLLTPVALSSITVFVLFIIFSLPFSLHFKPFVSGVGVLCAPEFLVKLGSVGPFLFEADHCQKSPLWQLIILYGFFFFFISSFLLFLKKVKQLLISDLFVLLLITLSILLILIPEFIYVKDIYPAHYRANTMFKLVFQAFMLLSLVSGYVIMRIVSTNKYLLQTKKGSIFFLLFFPTTILLVTMVFIYPFIATKSYYNNLQNYKSTDGTKYLETLHADDYKAISWINKNIQGQPVILEGQGDSYTDYGRISVHTGLPTVLGWTVHEWLWRGSYDLPEEKKSQTKPEDILDVPAPRITEISTMYESTNLTVVKKIIAKYQIEYVYVGDLEREKYPNLNENILKKIGKVIYQTGNTRIYKI